MALETAMWVQHFGPESNISSTTVLTAIKLGADVHAAQRTNLNDFADILLTVYKLILAC